MICWYWQTGSKGHAMQSIVVDTETTGLDPAKDGIVEIAGVWRTRPDDLEMFASFCDPGVPISPDSRGTHHIRDEQVRGSPAPLIALQQMLGRCGIPAADRIYVAHSAQFDRSFLQRQMESIGIVNRWICTYRCAMHLWPDAPNYKLQTLRYYLQLEPDVPKDLYPHRALYDAIVAEELLQFMLQQRRIEELIEMSQSPVRMKTVGFGKHRGELWENVPTSYLQWVVRQSDMDEDTLYTVRYWLRTR